MIVSNTLRRGAARMAAIASCTGIGLLLAAPATLALLLHRPARGYLIEVFVEPVSEDRARVSTIYQFDTGPSESWMGWTQDNGWWQGGADPILPRAEADALAETYRQELDAPHRISHRVFYQANDPGGTAFMVATSGAAAWGQKLGVVCVSLSLLMSLPLPLWSGRRQRRKP
jgi:hypothetical protein